MATEATVKQSLVQAMRKSMNGSLIFRHEDRHIFGVPDISCSWNGVTTWWEVKFATPQFQLTEIQMLNCIKLSKQGSKCGFIVFQKGHTFSKGNGLWIGEDSSTHIINPNKMPEWTIDQPSWFQCVGHDYKGVAEYIQGEHNALGR